MLLPPVDVGNGKEHEMSYTLDGTTLIVIAIAVLVAVVLIGWAIARQRKQRALRREFGPEYDHEVEVKGSRSQAVEELRARRSRVEEYDLHELSGSDRERLHGRWREVQKRFVDHPGDAVEEASALVDEAMRLRGYPLGEIQRKEADLSVHYPREVQDYRKAYAIAGRNRRGEASTEDLREATLYYRNLFEHLVGLEHDDDVSGRRREIA